MNEKLLLSIITPSYNRASLLSYCYKSLLEQSEYDFEWIIVDDGSSDNTVDVVNKFLSADNPFNITFIHKENGGKHTALNASHPYVYGKYVLILDSDDTLVPDAIAAVRKEWAKYDANKEIGIVTFLKGASISDPNCTAADEGVPVDILRYRRNCIHSSDCCEILRAELFLQYPFPVYKGERFVAECALWNRISFTHKCVYINKVIYICEYLEGGLTDSGRAMRIRNSRGGMFTSNLRMDKKNYFSQRVKYGLLYTCYGFFAGMNPVEMSRECRAKGLMWVCCPFGWIIYKKWSSEYGK